MRVLALDGALGAFSAAALDGAAAVAETGAGADALEAGLGRIAAVLDELGLGLGDLDRIAVGTGPGSFTGVRIAIAYAKALALARGLPLVGISSYDVLTPPSAPDPVLTIVQGRPGVVAARLVAGGEVRTAAGPVSGVLDALRLEQGRELALAGNTEGVSSALAERGIVVRALHRRNEPAALTIAFLALAAAPGVSAHAVAPDYGELPAATVRARG